MELLKPNGLENPTLIVLTGDGKEKQRERRGEVGRGHERRGETEESINNKKKLFSVSSLTFPDTRLDSFHLPRTLPLSLLPSPAQSTAG